MIQILRRLSLIGISSVLAACASTEGLGYYWQSAMGHLQVMREAKPIEEWLSDETVPVAVREKLKQVQEIRAYAVREIGLPDNGSYKKYADLKRPFVVWNVFATPELSMKLRQWCFPVAGCVSYRGYYSREDAQTFADSLKQAGDDVYVGGVPAYSTLGYFDDPVLNTFLQYPVAELARLVFHELSHQVVYVKNDSTFNESFATAVEEAAVERWIADQERLGLDSTDAAKRNAAAQLRPNYETYQGRKKDFVQLLKVYKTRLEALFNEAGDDTLKRQGKQALFQALQADYQQLKVRWNGFGGYDRWFAQGITNPHLASVGTYTDLVPAFRAILSRERGDFKRYFKACAELGALEPKLRTEALKALTQSADQIR
jgi:predicted aminopeptidase